MANVKEIPSIYGRQPNGIAHPRTTRKQPEGKYPIQNGKKKETADKIGKSKGGKGESIRRCQSMDVICCL